MSEIKTNFNLQNNFAANWAVEHAMELVPKASPKMAAAFAQLTAEWVLSGEGLEGFIIRIQEHHFGGNIRYKKERAERAAVYLSTKVFSHANAAEFEARGYEKALVLPPLCDGCRCYIQPGYMPDKAKVMVWYTGNDERVCTTSVTTSLGVVEGCKDLHRRVISAGKWHGVVLPKER